MAYGTASHFQSPISIKVPSNDHVVEKMKTNKNNVKFKIQDDEKTSDEARISTKSMHSNTESNESKMTSKKTYLDLSKSYESKTMNDSSTNQAPRATDWSNDPSNNSTEFLLVVYEESKNNTSKLMVRNF